MLRNQIVNQLSHGIIDIDGYETSPGDEIMNHGSVVKWIGVIIVQAMVPQIQVGSLVH